MGRESEGREESEGGEGGREESEGGREERGCRDISTKTRVKGSFHYLTPFHEAQI